MALVTYLLRADLRKRGRAWLALGLLIAVAGGVSMFAVAAWHRTSTAMDRFLVDFHDGDVTVVGQDLDRDALLALDEVLAAESGEYFFLMPDGPDGRPEPSSLGYVNPFSSTYGDFFHGMYDARVVEGRTPSRDAELEVAIDEELARTFDVGVGDVLPMTAVTPEQLMEGGGGVPVDADGQRFEFDITGIVRRPTDVVPLDDNASDVVYMGTRDVYLTPAFHRAHYQRDVAGASLFDDPPQEHLELRLAPGTDLDDLSARIDTVSPGAQTFFDDSDDRQASRTSDRAIGLQAMAVLAFGIVIAVVGALLALLATTRLVSNQLASLAVLRAIGVARSATVLSAVAAPLLATVAGAAGAMALAIALSPLSPIGFARRAESDPGVDVPVRVLLVGALVIIVSACAVSAAAALRATASTDHRRAAERPTLAARLARLGSRPGITCGLQLSRPAGGLQATAAATVSLACLAVVGSLTFAASANGLRDRQGYGWAWDAVVGNPNDPALFDELRTALADHRVVGAATAVVDGCGAILEHNGRTAEPDLVALEPLSGQIDPVLIAGRAPSGPSEIALGAVTADRLHVRVGDDLNVASSDCGTTTVPMRLTGMVLFNDGLMSDRIGEGAMVRSEALQGLGEEEVAGGVVLVDYAAGISDGDGKAALQADYGRTVLDARNPNDIDSLDRVRQLPLLVAGFVGVLAVATLVFTLGSVLRRCRRDLAVLKVAGLRPRQAAESILVLATALVLLPAVVGTVLGVVMGRLAWRLVTEGLGAPNLPEVALVPTLLAVPAALVAAFAIAAIPARQAARTRPAVTLRAE